MNKELKQEKEEFESALLIAFSIFLVILIGSVLVSDKTNNVGISGHVTAELEEQNTKTECAKPELFVIVTAILLSLAYLFVLNHIHNSFDKGKLDYSLKSLLNPLLLLIIILYGSMFFSTECEQLSYVKFLIITIITFLAVITYIYFHIFKDIRKRKKVFRGRK